MTERLEVSANRQDHAGNDDRSSQAQCIVTPAQIVPQNTAEQHLPQSRRLVWLFIVRPISSVSEYYVVFDLFLR
jgi:hypothetical protein